MKAYQNVRNVSTLLTGKYNSVCENNTVHHKLLLHVCVKMCYGIVWDRKVFTSEWSKNEKILVEVSWFGGLDLSC